MHLPDEPIYGGKTVATDELRETSGAVREPESESAAEESGERLRQNSETTSEAGVAEIISCVTPGSRLQTLKAAVLQAIYSLNLIIIRVALKLIWCYQRYISPLTPPSCRFHPTCSHYTYQAIERFGVGRGVWLGFCRICKCNPLHRGGFDPVPDTFPFPLSRAKLLWARMRKLKTKTITQI